MSRQAVDSMPSTGPSAKEQSEIQGGAGVGHMFQGEAAVCGGKRVRRESHWPGP